MSCDLLKLATPGVAGLQPYHPGKPVEELERELGIGDIIKLASNENPLGTGDRAREALRELTDFARYPDGNGFSLKATLAQYHGVEAEQITLGNGSNDILELIARAVVSPGQEVIFSEHAFAVYPLVAQAIGAESVVVPARNWAHDLEAMQSAITGNTRLMYIANPNNPTGTWSEEARLRGLLESVPEDMVVVVDEAYCDYVEEDAYPQCIHWLHAFPNLVVTRTFSKAHGLAGLRVGYGISHPALADLMNRVRQPFNNNTLALLAGEAALDDQAFVADSVALNARERGRLHEAFVARGLGVLASHANFLAVDCGRDAAPIHQGLLESGVIVRPMASYAMPHFLRITVGTAEQNDRLLQALDAVLTRMPSTAEA